MNDTPKTTVNKIQNNIESYKGSKVTSHLSSNNPYHNLFYPQTLKKMLCDTIEEGINSINTALSIKDI